MLAKTYASAVHGVEAQTITVEVNAGGMVAAGKMGYFLVGLPDNAVKEGWQRIEAAIKNIGLNVPRVKLVVNLAPADIRKEGSAYDLPIAMGILASTGQVKTDDLDKIIFMGEVALDGELRPIKGALPIAIQARKEGFKSFILPKSNAREAAIVAGIEVYGVENIREAIDFINGEKELVPLIYDTREVFADTSNQ
ncbi:MAG: magnesium chelatase domain-containing protein [Saprospiraceae bacterium]